MSRIRILSRNLGADTDLMGAIASFLCVIHCIATPFLFFIQGTSLQSCTSASPMWWSAIDFLFIGITGFAVYHSTKQTTSSFVKQAMFSTWIVLTLLIIQEKMGLFPISGAAKYTVAFLLIGLHLYNLKYCRCKDDSCCTT